MPATTLAVLGPLWVIGAQVLHSTLYVGLRWTAAYAELDREWLARLNGEKLIPMLVWSVLAAITLILPVLVFEQWPTTYSHGRRYRQRADRRLARAQRDSRHSARPPPTPPVPRGGPP